MFEYGNKPYTNAMEALCDACKPAKVKAVTNINQMDGTIVGLCQNHYSQYLKRQRELVAKGE